jgi:hypothetical protein
MTRRGVRLALLLLFVTTLATAAWFAFQAETRAAADRAGTARFDASARRALDQINDARGGLQACVAPGQGLAFWRPRVTSSLQAVTTELATLKSLARSPEALNDLDAAAAATEGIAAIHERAVRLVRNDDVMQASQVVFGEGLETVSSALGRLESARQQEAADADQRAAAATREAAYAAATAAGVGLFVLALLSLPLSAGAERSAPGPAADEAPAGEVAATAEPTPPAVDVAPLPLRPIADLCSDLARLGEPGELPSLLARAAEVLDARVLILWVGDAKGVELRPVLSHGYPAQALSRLAATPREADNATAAAWRHAALQVVPSSDVAAGALVVPLLTPEGCLGVLAAETRHGTERREPVQALARILAAQLSTLIGVPAAPAEAAPLESTSSAG